MTPIDVLNQVAGRGSAIGVDYVKELEKWGYKIIRARKPRKSQFCPTCKKHVPSPCVARQNTVGCPNLEPATGESTK